MTPDNEWYFDAIMETQAVSQLLEDYFAMFKSSRITCYPS